VQVSGSIGLVWYNIQQTDYDCNVFILNLFYIYTRMMIMIEHMD